MTAERKLGFAISLLMLGTVSAGAQTYTTVDVPGASGTIVSGINIGGTVAGTYADSSGVTRGFVRTADGTFTTFDPEDPKSYDLVVVAINRNGEVTGYYRSGRDNAFGFVRSASGKLKKIKPEGSTFTETVSINDAGSVTGTYEDSIGASHGFIQTRDGTVTEFDISGSTAYPNCINDSGEIVGHYLDSRFRTHGFLRTADGTITTFDVPNARSTFPTVINGKGVIAGNAAMIKNITAGFVRAADGTISDFYTDGSTTYTNSINAEGSVAGGYNDVGVIHSFLLRGGLVRGIDPPDSASSEAFSLNNGGLIAGYYTDSKGNYHGYIRTP